jgi:cytochrome c oxidase subunit IV
MNKQITVKHCLSIFLFCGESILSHVEKYYTVITCLKGLLSWSSCLGILLDEVPLVSKVFFGMKSEFISHNYCRWFPFLMTRACCEACSNLKAAFLVAVVSSLKSRCCACSRNFKLFCNSLQS